jgi:hypothetical protein
MNFFRALNGEVYGFDTETQQDLIAKAIADGWEDITSSWPPIPLPPPVPNVTAVQIRLQLNKQGLRTQVETAIASGSQDLKDKWQYGNMFSSADSDIQAMATSLGLTQEQLDTLFTEAATL